MPIAQSSTDNTITRVCFLQLMAPNASSYTLIMESDTDRGGDDNTQRV
jgi:hypothetical protein